MNYEYQLEEENDVERLFGAVTRIVPIKSKEATSQKAQEAMEKEMKGLDEEGTFGYLLRSWAPPWGGSGGQEDTKCILDTSLIQLLLDLRTLWTSLWDTFGPQTEKRQVLGHL